MRYIQRRASEKFNLNRYKFVKEDHLTIHSISFFSPILRKSVKSYSAISLSTI